MSGAAVHASPCRCWVHPMYGYVYSSECMKAYADSPNGKAMMAALNTKEDQP